MTETTDLTHVAFNAGQTTRSAPGAEPEEVIEQLRPIVSDGAGPVPLFEGWFLDVRPLRPAEEGGQAGGAYFQVSEQPPPSRTPAVMAVACWAEADAADCWDQADRIYRALRPELAALGLWRPPPRRPPPVPWVAAWLTPHAAAADPAVLQALVSVERAVARVLPSAVGRR